MGPTRGRKRTELDTARQGPIGPSDEYEETDGDEPAT